MGRYKKKIGKTRIENLRTIGLGYKRKRNDNKMRKKWNGWKLRKEDDVTLMQIEEKKGNARTEEEEEKMNIKLEKRKKKPDITEGC